MDFDLVLFILEILGTIAFAISGVMVAKKQKMDVFGALVLGGTTAVGGGVIRDLILGQTPPVMFKNPVYVEIAAITSLITFIVLYYAAANPSEKMRIRLEWILNVADSLGLGAFVVAGCRAAFNYGYGEFMFLEVFVGVVTGIGGGILRDMLAGQMPLIMRKRIYGIAAISGALLYVWCTELSVPTIVAALSTMGFITVVRALAMYYKWNLPSFH